MALRSCSQIMSATEGEGGLENADIALADEAKRGGGLGKC